LVGNESLGLLLSPGFGFESDLDMQAEPLIQNSSRKNEVLSHWRQEDK